MMIFTLALRELRSLFLSPLAWTILAVTQFILAYLFLTQLNEYIVLQPQIKMLANPPGATQLIVAPLYGSAAFIMMMIIPMLTMRLISEERNNKSLSLLLSAPISMSEIIVGKFLGVAGFLVIMIFLISLMPLSLLIAGPLDLGHLSIMIIGLLLLLFSFAAVGLFMSSLTAQPIVAAVSTFGILLLLWIIDWAGNKAGDENTSTVLSSISILRHFEAMTRGIFNSSDFVYYLLFITTFIVLSIRRLDSERLAR